MQHLREFLIEKANQYNCTDFIDNDPIAVPHRFNRKEDIEISGFLAATLAWGNRKAILKAMHRLMAWLDFAPYEFVLHATDKELAPLSNFKYRTFNGTDSLYFIKTLRHIYQQYGGLENIFTKNYLATKSIKDTISNFKQLFFSWQHEPRTQKHVANPNKGSAAKRINMYLRWMIRQDNTGVDFGIWKNIPMHALMIPLDVHSGTIARKLELLKRKQNDWKAVEELTQILKEFDPEDPVKFDFALFGLGINKAL